MRGLFAYFWSKNKNTYLEIAAQHKCRAIRVYQLAHGRKAKCDKDYDIIQSLVEKGIVSGYRMGYRIGY